MLAYPDFNKDNTLETDASKHGLGAMLSWYKDQQLHPVAYASHSVSTSEVNYAVTDLTTSHICDWIYENRPYRHKKGNPIYC